jgi:hypothetical protein
MEFYQDELEVKREMRNSEDLRIMTKKQKELAAKVVEKAKEFVDWNP